MFHLFTHAFFKSLLFLTAGGVLHSVGSDQDIYRFGGFNKSLPTLYSLMVLGSASLMGLPFFAG